MADIVRTFDVIEYLQKKGKKHLLAKRVNGAWQYYSARDYKTYVDWLSLGLLEEGVSKGTRVATLMNNCPEWNFVDMALAQIGAIQVPIYPNISDINYQFIFNNAEVEFAFVSNEANIFRIRKALIDNKRLKTIYTIDKVQGVRQWLDLVEKGKKSTLHEQLAELKNSIGSHDIISIIYTSGTTGIPKGVMLSQQNVVSNFMQTYRLLDVERPSRALSFLPLCHVLERIMNYSYQMCNTTIYYCDNIDQLRDYLLDRNIEIFTTVPRILEKFNERVKRNARNFKWIRKNIVIWAIRVGEKYQSNVHRSLWYKIQLLVARFFVLGSLRKYLSRDIKTVICGGAKLQENVCRLLWACGIHVIEGYGMTETSPVIAVGGLRRGDVKIGKVGHVLPGVNVSIADDNEILVKGPNVMVGYFNRPDLNKMVFDDQGWFHTGDIGYFDEDGFLEVTDRKREVFKTSGGKYISPLQIEMKLNASPFINTSIVIGEKRKFASALICPSYTYLESWCEKKGIEFPGIEACADSPIILDRIKEEVEGVNEQIDHVEQIRKFILITDKWSVETGELSPTLKLKRKFITNKYTATIDRIYRD